MMLLTFAIGLFLAILSIAFADDDSLEIKSNYRVLDGKGGGSNVTQLKNSDADEPKDAHVDHGGVRMNFRIPPGGSADVIVPNSGQPIVILHEAR